MTGVHHPQPDPDVIFGVDEAEWGKTVTIM